MEMKRQKKFLINHKSLMLEWDYNKNEQLGLNPGELSFGSNKKAWWICPKGHNYEAVIQSRVIRGDGCPYCSGHKAIQGVNDLATLYPQITEEWDYKKNEKLGLYTSAVSYGSSKKAWWVCPKGHEYETAINRRTLRGNGCPICSGHKTVSGVNDFATLFPEIAKEWHPTRNGDLKANEVSKKNGRKVWWQCKYGHEWQATVKDRVIDNTGCPKLDGVDYSEKLTEIIRDNDIKSVTIVRMDVPCCGGLQRVAENALRESGRFIPWQVVTISRDGRILD